MIKSPTMSSITESLRSPDKVEDCSFCEIAQGTRPHVYLAGTKDSLAFLSNRDGHPLVIPRRHILSPDSPFAEREVADAWYLASYLYPHAKQAFKTLGEGTNLGFRMLINDEEAQHIPHLHIHIKALTGRDATETPFRLNHLQQQLFARDVRNRIDIIC